MTAPESIALPPRVAFVVREIHGDGCCVQYARYNVVARREGASELDADFRDVECTRYPAFDDYATRDIPVPDDVLVEHGWWFECSQCGQKIESEPMDGNGDPITLEPIYLGSRVFCTPQCQLNDAAEKIAKAMRAGETERRALEKWPGITITYKNGHPPPEVSFFFPGGEFAVKWKLGANTVLVAKKDTEAWAVFSERVRKQKQES